MESAKFPSSFAKEPSINPPSLHILVAKRHVPLPKSLAPSLLYTYIPTQDLGKVSASDR